MRRRRRKAPPRISANARAVTTIGGSQTGQVTAAKDVGTDRERVDSFTAELANGMNTIGEGKPWRFSHFRKTEGYANMPLDGLWAAGAVSPQRLGAEPARAALT